MYSFFFFGDKIQKEDSKFKSRWQIQSVSSIHGIQPQLLSVRYTDLQCFSPITTCHDNYKGFPLLHENKSKRHKRPSSPPRGKSLISINRSAAPRILPYKPIKCSPRGRHSTSTTMVGSAVDSGKPAERPYEKIGRPWYRCCGFRKNSIK